MGVQGMRQWGTAGSATFEDLTVTDDLVVTDDIMCEDLTVTDDASIADLTVTTTLTFVNAIAPAGHAACAILNSTTRLVLTVDDASNVAISTTSSVDGQRIFIQMVAAAGGGSYTLAVTGGTLTFNAANETAIIERVGAAWVVFSLVGATIV